MDSSRAVRDLVVWTLLVCASHPLVAAEAARKYALQSARQSGELTHVEASFQVGGDLKLVTDGKPKDLPMSVVAKLSYDERLLALDRNHRPQSSARHYAEAGAVIKVDKGGEKPTLDQQRRLIAVERSEKSPALLYCPTASLTREELDLIDIPGNTLLVDALLPAREVALGESWKLADKTLADLLCLEAVSWTDVQGVLGQVSDGVAEIAAAGSVSGAVGGITTEIELKAKYRFDLKQKRITYLALLIKEKRAVGHIGPGLDTVAKLIMQIRRIASSENLNADALGQVTKTTAPERLQLAYASPANQFGFQYDRRWYVTNDDPKLTVLRLLDRGELMAQCNISVLAGEQKKPINLADFQRDVQNSLGKNFGQFVKASQDTNDAGYTVLRVAVHGTVSQLPIEWIYYLVENRRGQRVSLAFTLEASLQERFAQADRLLVGDLRLLEPAAPTAAKPAPKKDAGARAW
jgi:hypothetical protein